MTKATSIVVAGVLAVLTALLLLVLVLRLASSPDSKVKLGSDTFDVGVARALAVGVDRRGPLLFQDPLNRGRDIFVDHLGGDRWVAFEARRPGCALHLDRTRGDIRDCRGRAVRSDRPPTRSYPVRVDADGHLIVDLRTRR